MRAKRGQKVGEQRKSASSCQKARKIGRRGRKGKKAKMGETEGKTREQFGEIKKKRGKMARAKKVKPVIWGEKDLKACLNLPSYH